MSSFEFAVPYDSRMAAGRAAETSVRESEERKLDLDLDVFR